MSKIITTGSLSFLCAASSSSAFLELLSSETMEKMKSLITREGERRLKIKDLPMGTRRAEKGGCLVRSIECEKSSI